MTEGRQFKKPQDVTDFFERIQHEEQKQVWSSCVAAARAEYVSAKSQVEQSIRDIRVRMQIGGASAAFWQKQLQLKTAEYDALDLLASDVGDEEADATCGVSRSIERVWNAFARAEEISSETELLDIIMEMEQGAQSGGASSEFVEMQLKHKMEELQSVQATNASDRERAATRHPVLRGSDAHARAQQVLAESCLINIIQQLKELEHCGGDIADFVQEQLRLKMTELQDLQARKDFAREARRAQSLSQQQAARQASDCRVGISFVRVQRMVAESLLIRLVLNCEEQGQNGGGTAFFMQRKLWIERLRALQKEGHRELWNEQLQELAKEASAGERYGEETWRMRVKEWLVTEEHPEKEGTGIEHASSSRRSEKVSKRKRKERSSPRPPLHTDGGVGGEGGRAGTSKAARKEKKPAVLVPAQVALALGEGGLGG